MQNEDRPNFSAGPEGEVDHEISRASARRAAACSRDTASEQRCRRTSCPHRVDARQNQSKAADLLTGGKIFTDNRL
jgi:hypothetical protein